MTALWFHSPVNQSTKLQGHQDDLGEIYIFYHLKSTTLKDQMVFPFQLVMISHIKILQQSTSKGGSHFISHLTISYHLLLQHPASLEKNAVPV